MNTCERVTDLLPELASGSLPEAEAAALHAHILTCDDCASEWLLIAALRDAPAPDAGLAARITSAVVSRPMARQGWGARHLTVAATIVMAMIGGGIAIQQFGPQTRLAETVATSVDSSTSPASAATSPGTTPSNAAPLNAVTPGAGAYVSDPAVGNGSILPQMTERQLEALLAEMGS
jgi:hypothetical protein